MSPNPAFKRNGRSEANLAPSRVDVLHVPFTYFPDPSGGTEVYVVQLVSALQGLGMECAVAAPGRAAEDYLHMGSRVLRFPHAKRGGRAAAYGAPDAVAAQAFSELLQRVRPAIVHLHARTAAVSNSLVEAAHAAGSKVVFTYHTPTASCARGTMMWMGRTPCDGRLDRVRCTTCVLAGRGVPLPLGAVLAFVPQTVGAVAARLPGRVMTPLATPALIEAQHSNFRTFIRRVDHLVAVCDWVRNALLEAGAPATKVTVCRQGIRAVPVQPAVPTEGRAGPGLNLAFFGRVDATKGVGLLLRALASVPDAQVSLTIFGVMQEGSAGEGGRLAEAVTRDPRVCIRPAVAPEAVISAMSSFDAVVVPSQWMETGPLVVLEAFAAGRPVIGSRLGGIAELVTDGVDGVLVEPADVSAWARTLSELAGDPNRISTLQANVRPPRTMAECAREMADVYERVWG